jgi:hypothetical protein
LKWKKQRVGALGAKSKMTKHQAQDSLDEKIAQRTGGTTQPRADEHIVTLGWYDLDDYDLEQIDGVVYGRRRGA